MIFCAWLICMVYVWQCVQRCCISCTSDKQKIFDHSILCAVQLCTDLLVCLLAWWFYESAWCWFTKKRRREKNWSNGFLFHFTKWAINIRRNITKMWLPTTQIHTHTHTLTDFRFSLNLSLFAHWLTVGWQEMQKFIDVQPHIAGSFFFTFSHDISLGFSFASFNMLYLIFLFDSITHLDAFIH